MIGRFNIWELMIIVPLFIISIGLHEAAHAYAAHYLGDKTPANEGRLTLNPLVHLDPLGTIMLVMVGFGWGRSVNVEPRQLQHPQRDMALIAAAGPLSNFVIGLISILGFALVQQSQFQFLNEAFLISANLNFLLMFLNLVPIPPLDGSKVLRAFLPYKWGQKFDEFEPYGSIVFLALVLIPGISSVFMGGLGYLTQQTMETIIGLSTFGA